MIGQLRGVLVDKRPNQVIVDTGGVGYQVQIPLSTTAREKQCFEMLISASGVGPSLALKILSGMNLDELVPAIRKGDVLQLKRIPGVGQKTAERIILELRDKLAVVEVADTGKPASRSQVESDVASALVNLGYDERFVEKALEQVRGAAGSSFDALLRAALQKLGGAAIEKGARAARND